jgi:hypothetical protein
VPDAVRSALGETSPTLEGNCPYWIVIPIASAFHQICISSLRGGVSLVLAPHRTKLSLEGVFLKRQIRFGSSGKPGITWIQWPNHPQRFSSTLIVTENRAIISHFYLRRQWIMLVAAIKADENSLIFLSNHGQVERYGDSKQNVRGAHRRHAGMGPGRNASRRSSRATSASGHSGC